MRGTVGRRLLRWRELLLQGAGRCTAVLLLLLLLAL